MTDVQLNPGPPEQVPLFSFPRDYNAAADLIGRNLEAGRGGKTAFIDDDGSYTYQDVADRAARCANLLGELGVEMEQRILICMLDSIDWPSVFLGSVLAGVRPVCISTLQTPASYEYMLTDSRARVAFVSTELLPAFLPQLGKLPFLRYIVVSGDAPQGNDRVLSLADLMAKQPTEYQTAPTVCDEECFWLYSSGSTGLPKGTSHRHTSLMTSAQLYAQPILGIGTDDVTFSIPKLFFAYGLGNGLTFPMSVGATSVLMAERPVPSSIFKRLVEHKPTVFFGVPTAYAGMLASPYLPAREDVALRICSSAGEALPADVGRRWTEHFGVEILDGIGSTEMLHVYMSNRRGNFKYGTTGWPVPGYEVRLVDDDGQPVPQGELGHLHVKGPTHATCYWNNCARSESTFLGPWQVTGDKYSRDEEGFYVFGGRADDMLNASGMPVSPFEVESALITHPMVLEAAVVGKNDEDGLSKPMAYVVALPGVEGSEELAAELKKHVKSSLAPYKYPRWIEFVAELPKTPTGKLQRYKLREIAEQPSNRS